MPLERSNEMLSSRARAVCGNAGTTSIFNGVPSFPTRAPLAETPLVPQTEKFPANSPAARC